MAWNVYRGLGQTSGFGAATLVFCVAGLWIGRRRPEVQLTVAAFAGLVVLTMTFPGGWSPWWVVREIVPGTAALRAVTRVGMMALFPAALGLAIVVGRALEKGRWALAAVLILFTVIEQPHQRPKFDKYAAVARIESIASEVPANAESFLLVIKDPTWDKFIHDDAAWTALAAGVPTINGRYGHFPRGYPFKKPWIQTPEDEAALRAGLETWATEGGMDLDKIPVIEVTPRPPRPGW